MFKIIRTVAPVILVIFISTSIIAPAWGKENPDKNADKITDVQITMSLYSYDLAARKAGSAIDKPEAGQPILLDLKVQGKGSQITDVILLQDSFAYIDSYDEQDASPWVHRKAFILQAPDKAGTYTLTFKCSDKFGDSVIVSANIEVVPVSQTAPTPPEQTAHYTYKIMPVEKTQVVTPAQKTSPQSTTYTQTHYSSSSSHTYRMGDWGTFWFGFIVGVIVAAVCYSAGAASAK